MKAPGKKSAAKRTGAKAARPTRTAASAGRQFPIVGVGASAGGLEAFTQLLRHLPVDTGFGFVLVQHLDPQHESALARLLTRATAMPVHEVTDNLRVKPNHVYIIPPNTSLGIAHGVLKLRPRSENRSAHRAVDLFFEALAKDRGERAIGVILSGTATDGTLGLEAIKAEGGLTFAQDDSARYDSMPRNAVAAGCVDFVLSPEKIARELTRIAKHPYVAGQAPGVVLPPATAGGGSETGERNGFPRILLLLRNHSGVDFSLYKSSTIQRRIMRRTVLSRQASPEKYADFLQGNTKELDALYSDVLISVTSFFRNPEAFELLKRKVFPRLLAQRGDEPLRVWVLGCSTGQEAFSLAMAFAEAAEKVPHAHKLQVFATDLNEANLARARRGLYAKSLVHDVSPERLRRFFTEEDGGYRVIKPLRELVVFAQQNVISDPPFSRMDLISCRNVMIYLEPSLQKKVFPNFHYALKPEGYLFLGASESIGNFTDLFTPVDKRQKLFAKKAATSRAFQLPDHKQPGRRAPAGPVPPAALPPGKRPEGPADAWRGELSAEREADRVTVNQFAPPSVLINADLQILQFRGPTGAYLEPPTGKASFDLLKMARDGLMLPLRAVIERAKKENRTTRTEQVRVRQNGRTRLVDVEVVPLKNLKERSYLVVFEDAAARGRATPEAAGPAGPEPRRAAPRDEPGRITALERDLAEARDYLQSIQEYQEAANEELQASNEEGQSANEELQSLNEELETSKEELESTNEELTTVNEEMVNRNAELNRLNNDLTNLETSTNLVIVLLNRDLTIRRFSTQAEKQFNLLAVDVGRPFGTVRHNLALPGLDAIITSVIASGQECEREVRTAAGRWYSLRVRPYLTQDKKVDGAVLVLMDIDELKRTERLISEEHEHAEAIIRTVPDPLVILTADLRLLSANESFYRAFKVTPAEAKHHLIYELDRGSWNIPALRRLLEDILPRNSFFDDFEVTHHFARLGRRSLLLNARMLKDPGGSTKEILLGIHDITDRKLAEEALHLSEERYRTLFTSMDEGFCLIEMIFNKQGKPVDWRYVEVNPSFEKHNGLHQAKGKRMSELAPGLESSWYETYGKVALTGQPVRFVREAKALGGRWFDLYAFRVGPATSRNVAVIFTNITERMRTEKALREAQVQLAQHAGQLEKQVARRTAELTSTNRRLETSVRSISRGKEEYRQLLVEAQVMHKKLRHLTHQILTAQEEERKKISRELHDDVVQTLVGINVELAALVHGNSAGVRQLKNKIAHTQRLVEKSVDSVHRFARELRPAVLDDLGLIPALHAYCVSLAARKKLKIKLTAFGGVEALDSDKRTVLFRVVQEALTNVARHAHATQAQVVITKVPGAVRLEVRDNGKSFKVKKALQTKYNKRLGLVGMRERIEMVGGNLAIESVSGKGTTVRAEIPFNGAKL